MPIQLSLDRRSKFLRESQFLIAQCHAVLRHSHFPLALRTCGRLSPQKVTPWPLVWGGIRVMAAGPKVLYEFGPFQVDPERQVLLREGCQIALTPKAFDTLLILVRNSREVVSKDDLMKSVWPDAFVEEGNLSQNIFILRKALGDTAQDRRYIVTIPGKGYRFVEQVRTIVQDGNDLVIQSMTRASTVVHQFTEHAIQTETAVPDKRAWWKDIVLGVTALLLLVVAVGARPPVPRVVRLRQITNSGRVDPWGRIVTNGDRIYYLERYADRWRAMQASAIGGPSEPLNWQIPGRNYRVVDVSPDHRKFLVGTFEELDEEMPLWIEPATGGFPIRLGNVFAYDAAWSRNGREIVFSHGDEILVINESQQEQKIATAPGIAEWFSWSVDDSHIRFSVRDPHTYRYSLWELRRDGTDLHAVSATGKDWLGQWTPDGKNYVFTSNRDGQQNLWLQTTSKSLTQLTAGPNDYFGGVPAPDGQSIFAAVAEPKFDVARVSQLGSISRFWDDIKVTELSFSRDGSWIVYSSGGVLFRSRPDGTDRFQLKASGIAPAHAARIAPNNHQIAYEDLTPRGTMALYTGPLETGEGRLVVEHLSRPDWSPDGTKLVADSVTPVPPARSTALYIVDPATGSLDMVPGSEGLQSPRWSPDGRYLTALRWSMDGPRQILIFDFNSHRWYTIGTARYPTIPEWTRDSRQVYYQDLLEESQPVFQVEVGTMKHHRIAAFKDASGNKVLRTAFLALSPTGDLIVSVTRNIGDIYALQLQH